MDQNKKCKFGTYYSELLGKYGLVLPVFCALAAFAVLFYINFVDAFAALKAVSSISLWLTIIGALVGIVLLLVYIVTHLKEKEVGAADELLLTLCFLEVFVLVGIVSLDFASLNTVYFAVALVITIVLTVLRVLFSDPTVTPVKRAVPNVTFKKYYSTVSDKYGFWKPALAAVITFGFLLVSNIRSFPSLFVENVSYTVGLLIVGGIALALTVYGIIVRLKGGRINNVDAFMTYLLYVAVLDVLLIVIDFSVLGLVLWFVGLCVILTILRVLSACTRVDEETTDKSFFNTDSNTHFVRNPKVYFKHLISAYNPFALGAIAFILFALLNTLAVTDFFGWSNANGFMVYAVIAILVFYCYGIAYFATNLKRTVITERDGALIILDGALILLAISILANLKAEGIMASLVFWAIAFVLCVAFTIVRMFRVREAVDAPEVESQADETKTETAESESVKAETAESVKAETAEENNSSESDDKKNR